MARNVRIHPSHRKTVVVTYPTRTSVLKHTSSTSCPATLFCIAWTILSSVTASATWSSLRLESDEDDGRATCPRGSGRFLRGMPTMANFRGCVDRFTMKTFQENGLPTSTLEGPENETVTPRPVAEYALSLSELLVAGPPVTELDWFGVIGRLAGRLFRCNAWLGPPNVGLRAMEKSTFVRHCINIRGLQSSDSFTVASNEISKTLIITVVEGFGSGPYSGVNL